MSTQAALVVFYVLLIFALVVLIIVSTVAIRRNDDPVKKARAITAEYEVKDDDTIPHDWERYYRDHE